MASGRTAFASSGMISGVGLARASTSGFGAMRLSIAGLRAPAADRPRKMSALSNTSASVAASLSRQNLPRHLSLTSCRLVVSSPSLSATQMFSSLAPSASRMLRQAIAAAPAPLAQILTSSIFLPLSSSPLSTAAPTMIAVPCWSS
jgi:hypothetical protein